MLAVMNQNVLYHRASAYNELHAARTKLMGLRQTRSGLFVTKTNNPFSCHTILSLLADIAKAKFDALRILLSLDAFEKQLRDEARQRKAHRIWLGSMKEIEAQHEQHPEPKRIRRMDGVTTFLLTTLWLRSLQKPRI